MANIVIFLVSVYRKFLSILKLQPCCRFYPTCSEYAILSLKKHGFLRGSLFSVFRILRCHPLSSGGYDPVPEVK
ncbi:MAG: membrane protein insertion efficiency factor YidD [Candidatus Omnitrophica bacterium]|nr:membrane protein insertion efficiency factor YidD [Candidatus Omnitrophota bacterium]